MIQVENLKKIVEKIQEQTAEINPDRYLLRVKYCYSNEDKEKYKNQYEQILALLDLCKSGRIPYRTLYKENFYLGKCDIDFEKIEDFNILRNSIEKKEGEILTVTTKNIDIYIDLINEVITNYK